MRALLAVVATGALAIAPFACGTTFDSSTVIVVDDAGASADGATGSTGTTGDAATTGSSGPCRSHTCATVVATAAVGSTFVRLAANDDFAAWIELDATQATFYGQAAVDADGGVTAGTKVTFTQAADLSVGSTDAYIGHAATGTDDGLAQYFLASESLVGAGAAGMTVDWVDVQGGEVYFISQGAIYSVGALAVKATPSQLALGGNSYSNLHVSSSHLYVYDSHYGALLQCPLASCGDISKFTTVLRDFAADGVYSVGPDETLYWVANGALNGCGLGADCTKGASFGSAVTVDDVVVDGTDLYWSDPGDRAVKHASTQVPVVNDAGSESTLIATDDTLGLVAVNATSIFWVEGTTPPTLYRVPR